MKLWSKSKNQAMGKLISVFVSNSIPPETRTHFVFTMMSSRRQGRGNGACWRLHFPQGSREGLHEQVLFQKLD